MKVVQMLTSLAYGDAIGNETMAIYRMLKEEGYDTFIYAEAIDERIRVLGITGVIDENLSFSSDDIIFYHLSTGCKWNLGVFEFGAKVIVIYHNITPPVFMGGPGCDPWYMVETGIRDLKQIAPKVKYCIAVSGFNRDDLLANGFGCDIKVIPLLIPFEDYKTKASEKILEKYSQIKSTKILFTGRVASNKKIEDVIATFNEYRLKFDNDALLFLVGKHFNDGYYLGLKKYAESLNSESIIFTGHIDFDEILAYYSVSDCFLCMSEHEGFCVPLVEAMYFDLPVIAYDSSAIKDTLGGAGFLLDNKNPLEAACVVNRVIRDLPLRERIINNQRERLKAFRYDVIKGQILDYLRKVIEE